MRSGGVFDLAGLEQEIARLEAEASDGNLWSDSTRAHAVMQKLSRLSGEVASWKALEEQL